MTTTEPTPETVAAAEVAPEAIEELARVLDPHTQSFGSNDEDFWAYCTCSPNVVLLSFGRSAAPSAVRDRGWYIRVAAMHREHVAHAVLAAGYVSPERYERTVEMAREANAEAIKQWNRADKAEATNAAARTVALVEALANDWEADRGILSPDSRYTRDVLLRELRQALRLESGS